MNFSNPILICDENEEFRILVRDMLTKNGFFHIIEASSQKELFDFLKVNSNDLVLIEQKMLSSELKTKLKEQKNYIIFANSTEETTPLIAATMGVEHVLSYPFYSRKLIDKINTLL